MEENKSEQNNSEEIKNTLEEVIEEKEPITLHRVLSWFLNIFLISPCWILMCVVKIPFHFFNVLHYKNFYNIYIEGLNVIPEKLKSISAIHFCLFFGVIIGYPLGTFYNELKALKTLKF